MELDLTSKNTTSPKNTFRDKILADDLFFDASMPQWKQERRAANCFINHIYSSFNDEDDKNELEFQNLKNFQWEELVKDFCLSSSMLPVLVNAAFALELLLRSILTFEGKKAGDKHNTYNMFTRIDKKTRILIVRTITYKSNQSCQCIPDNATFHEEFQNISSMFTKGRYYYKDLNAPFLKQQHFVIVSLIEILFIFANRKMEKFYKRYNLLSNLPTEIM